MTTRRIRNALMAVIAIMTMAAGAISADAANLVVRNFKMLPTDQTAINRETMKRDQNGKTSALIKIYTPLNEEQTYFDNGVMGVVARINKPGQIWLYIPARSQSIQIINSKYSPLTYFFDEEIVAGKTYSMELTVEGKEVTLSASVRQSPIWVDNDSVGISPLNIYLSYGEHAVKAEKGSMLYEGSILVTPNGERRFELPMEDENLKYSDVTVRVPDNADIYFQGRRVGVGEWTERLLGGNYSVEIRKANCENAVVNFEAKAGSPTIVDCPKPVPYRGYLSVDVIPNTGTKILDGDTLVAEHRLQRQLNVGTYTYTFRKSGYVPVNRTFKVERNQDTVDTVTLQRIQYIRKKSVYFDVGFTYANIYGVTLRVGGTFANVNLEVGYTLGLGKSDEVNWFDTDGIYDGSCTYSMDVTTLKLGYQFSFVERIGLTPQIGYLGQQLRGGTRGNGAMCHNMTIGARFVFNPSPRFGIFATPEYAVPVQENELYKQIAEYGNLSKGGFYVTAGLTFNF